jgi:predicted peptidase
VRQPRQTEEQRAAETARRNALTQAERDTEDKERRLRSFESVKNPPPFLADQTQTMNYWLFLPSDYKPNMPKKYPLLLFLHGSGERGNDIEKVKIHGPPKLLADPEKAKDWQFITVSPQCPDGYSWSPKQLKILLDQLEKQYKVDKNRIYVTGLSMGGFGTWGLLYNYPNYFAAGVPICGGFDPAEAKRYINTPLWVFHGAKDGTVRVTMSTDMVDAIQAAGGKRVKLTVYPDLEHDSWTVTYDNPELYQWLLQQKLGRRTGTRPQPLRPLQTILQSLR